MLELVPTSQDDATPLLSTASFASAAQRPQREAQPSRHWDSRSRKCVLCSAAHPPQACTSVTDPSRRWDIVRSKRLCFNCLGPHHASACPTTVRCRTCGKKHHTSLCDPAPPAHRDAASVSRSSTQALPSLQPPVQTPPTVTEPPNSPMTAGHTTCATSPACLATGEQVILQMAYSTVSGEDGSSMATHLLLDSGSQRTYMSECLARQLRLQPVLQEPLAVSTFGDTRPFTMDTYRLMMALTPKRLFLSLCISISLLRSYTFFSRSPLVFKTLFDGHLRCTLLPAVEGRLTPCPERQCRAEHHRCDPSRTNPT